jgi:hypothetical protein
MRRGSLMRPLAALALPFALALSGAAQVVPSGGAPQGPRTGLIVGQVIDGTTGQPIPEAIVNMTTPGLPPDAPTMTQGRVMADDKGRFFFADLPAGEFWLYAAKDGYVSGAYGQRRVGQRGETVPLRTGERRTDIVLRVWKYAVIGGTVVDEAGEPVVGVAVRALVRDIVAGRAQFGTQSHLVPSGVTDDRGVFRLPGVQPGAYAVVVPSTQATVPVSVMQTWDAATMRTELFWAGVFEASPLGHPRTQQVGDLALMTLNSVLIPPPASAGHMTVYRSTYYPSTLTAAEATLITVGAGDERTDLAIALQPSPAVRVSGRLVTPNGSAPPPFAVKLVGQATADVVMPPRSSGTAEVGLDAATGVSDANGRFTLLGVPPGEYVLTHADPFLSRAAQQGRQPYWVSQRITVGDEDLQDLVVPLKHALRVEGRIELRGAAGPPPPQTLMFERPFGEPDQFAISGRDGVFATVAAGGRYIVRAVEAGGWFVDAITLDGRNITDRPFDLQADATSIVVTYTDRGSRLSGTVKDARGAASAAAVVLAFHTDPQRWAGFGRSPRVPRSVTASPAGSYTIEHLPPGDYFVVAIDEDDSEGWRDPKTLQVLANRAERITVAAGDPSRTLDLTVRPVR